jgi:regulator of nucleoside diphosphate kinase
MKEGNSIMIEAGHIYITDVDRKRLEKLLSTRELHIGKDKQHLESLKQELENAMVVESKKIPSDVITMNSQVQLTNLVTGEILTWTLVFPWNANFDQGKISILAPVGTALIGCKVKDVVEFEVLSGHTRLRIDAILYQPEAAGDYHL